MEKIEFGAVLTSEYDGFLVERDGTKCYIEFANGEVVEEKDSIISLIAKEIASLKFKKNKEVGVYSLYNGIIVCDNEKNSCGEKLFSSNDVDIHNIDKITMYSEQKEKVNLSRKKINEWKVVLNKGVSYYDEQKVVELVFAILLMEFENKSETFEVKKTERKLTITL